MVCRSKSLDGCRGLLLVVHSCLVVLCDTLEGCLSWKNHVLVCFSCLSRARSLSVCVAQSVHIDGYRTLLLVVHSCLVVLCDTLEGCLSWKNHVLVCVYFLFVCLFVCLFVWVCVYQVVCRSRSLDGCRSLLLVVHSCLVVLCDTLEGRLSWKNHVLVCASVLSLCVCVCVRRRSWLAPVRAHIVYFGGGYKSCCFS